METQEIKEYLNKLPSTAKQVIVSIDWHSRVSEIGKKYSLEQKQVDDLEYEILFVLLGIEADTNFIENIQKQLNISGLLANQIGEEVDTRVFGYLLDLIQKKEPVSKSVFDSAEIKKPGIPEIRPLNTLEVLKNEPVKNNVSAPKYASPLKPAPSAPNNLLGQTISEQKQNPVLPKITFIPKNPTTPATNVPASQVTPQSAPPTQVNPAQEQVVSRLALDIKKPEPNIIDNKLNNVTGGIKDSPAENTPPQKYNIDPYREPLE